MKSICLTIKKLKSQTKLCMSVVRAASSCVLGIFKEEKSQNK